MEDTTMSTRKTTTERIELQKEKMEQMQNEMNRLKRQHNAEERKKRNHRICKRGAHIESLLPDTIVLSDERFFAFLEKTITNDFGRKTLATLKAEQDKDDAKSGTVSTDSSGEALAEPAVSPSHVCSLHAFRMVQGGFLCTVCGGKHKPSLCPMLLKETSPYR